MSQIFDIVVSLYEGRIAPAFELFHAMYERAVDKTVGELVSNAVRKVEPDEEIQRYAAKAKISIQNARALWKAGYDHVETFDIAIHHHLINISDAQRDALLPLFKAGSALYHVSSLIATAKHYPGSELTKVHDKLLPELRKHLERSDIDKPTINRLLKYTSVKMQAAAGNMAYVAQADADAAGIKKKPPKARQGDKPDEEYDLRVISHKVMPDFIQTLNNKRTGNDGTKGMWIPDPEGTFKITLDHPFATFHFKWSAGRVDLANSRTTASSSDDKGNLKTLGPGISKTYVGVHRASDPESADIAHWVLSYASPKMMTTTAKDKNGIEVPDRHSMLSNPKKSVFVAGKDQWPDIDNRVVPMLNKLWRHMTKDMWVHRTHTDVNGKWTPKERPVRLVQRVGVVKGSVTKDRPQGHKEVKTTYEPIEIPKAKPVRSKSKRT